MLATPPRQNKRLDQGRWFLFGQVLLVVSVVLLSTLGSFSAPLVLAFAPILIRGTLWFLRRQQPLNVHRLGISELGQSLVLGGLL